MTERFESDAEAISAITHVLQTDSAIPDPLRPGLLQWAALFLVHAEDDCAPEEPALMRWISKTLAATIEDFMGGRQDVLVSLPSGKPGAKKYWAIRNEHIDFVRLCGPLALQLAAANADPARTSGTVVAVALLVTVLQGLEGLRRRGVSLSQDDYQILVCLKNVGPLSDAAIAEKLNGPHPQQPWVAATVAARLNVLNKFPSQNGVEALVTQDGQGLWISNGL